MATQFQFYAESSVRGYHAYKQHDVHIGEILRCERERDNPHDICAVGVYNESGSLVGHVPIELSAIFSRFLDDYGELEAECIGSRFNNGEGKGLQFPVDYRLIGNKKYLKTLQKELTIINIAVVRRLSKITSFELLI